jgi:hypothetical protein
LTVLALGVAFFAAPNFVSAQTPTPVPQPHTYEYRYIGTNLYTNTALIYAFDDLDSTVTYEFTVQELDSNASVISTISTMIIGPGVTAQGAILVPFNQWPNNNEFTAPIRVVDNFGQILAHHFVAPTPHADWTSTSGINDEFDKVAFGRVPYSPVIPNYHHDNADHTKSLTRYGDYELLHYRLDSTAGPTTDLVRLWDIESGTFIADFSLQEMVDYNDYNSLAFGISITPLAFTNFVIVSTDGNRPPFVNPEAEIYAFTGGGRNPHTYSLDRGVYEYNKIDSGGSLIVVGESVWIVANQGDFEWSFTVDSLTIRPEKRQILTLRQRTQDVHEDYPVWLVSAPLAAGTVLDDVVEFQSSRRIAFEVSDIPGLYVVAWVIQAQSMTHIPSIVRSFTFQTVYEVTDPAARPGFGENISNLFDRFGLSTDFGNILVMITLMIGGFYGASRIGGSLLIQLVVFLVVGGGFILLGRAHSLTVVIYAATAIMAVFLYLRTRSSGSDNA